MAQALKCQIAHPALGLLRGTNFGGHGVAILASKQSAPGGHFGSAVSCFDAVSCLGATNDSGPTMLRIGQYGQRAERDQMGWEPCVDRL